MIFFGGHHCCYAKEDVGGDGEVDAEEDYYVEVHDNGVED